jgi:hypothetical protein
LHYNRCMTVVRRLGVLLLGLGLSGMLLTASGQEERHGRKYKTPPPASHIEVTVLKANGKPVANAAVIFHPLDKSNQDQGNMEIKTNRDGVASLDVIPVGDTILLQVIADGFQTYGQNYTIDGDSKLITVQLHKPAGQISAYTDHPGATAPPLDSPNASTPKPAGSK